MRQEHLVVRSLDNRPAEHLVMVLKTGEIAFLGSPDELIYDIVTIASVKLPGA